MQRVCYAKNFDLKFIIIVPITNGRYNLVITDAIAMAKLYFSVHKTFWELKIYYIIVTCVNCVYCTRYSNFLILYF
jgi:hypothetical protein